MTKQPVTLVGNKPWAHALDEYKWPSIMTTSHQFLTKIYKKRPGQLSWKNGQAGNSSSDGDAMTDFS